MHVGGLTIVEGPPPPMEEFLEQIRRRLHLVPRYRHKLAYTALDSGRPVWIDDPSFNLDYHVRHTALPTPGDWEQLRQPDGAHLLPAAGPLQAAVGDVADRGAAGRRFALISKTHHALIDGIAGIDLATVLFDLSPDPPPMKQLRARVAPAPRTGHRGAGRGRPEGGGARRDRAGGGRPGRARAPRSRAGAHARGGGGHRRDRVGGAEPGAGDAAERSISARTGASSASAAGWRTSSSSRTRSGAPSTTSCWRSSRARCASS